jgi:uncharacterized protein
LKLHLAQGSGLLFTSSGNGFVSIQGQQFNHSVIVDRERVVAWNLSNLNDLAEDSLSVAESYRTDVILLGTGARFMLPDLLWLRTVKDRLAARGAGLEIMDTPAACRTFNVLSEEGRSVVAALIVNTA